MPGPRKPLGVRSGHLGAKALAAAVIFLLGACQHAPKQGTPENVQHNTSVPAPQEDLEHVAHTPETPMTLAASIASGLQAGHFEAVHSHFDTTVAAMMSAGALEQVWANLGTTQGPLLSIGVPRVSTEAGFEVVLTRLEFQNGALDFKLVFSQDHQVAGLFFLPPQAEWEAPSYANPEAFTETNVEVGSSPWTLPGVLTVPTTGTRFPAVVLVHGSGPNDKDETLGPNKPFKDLAYGLASNGVVVLRYDKRTLVHGPAFAENKAATVQEESIDDALVAAELLRAHPKVDPAKVFVIGHSLGATLVPRIVEQDPKLAGAVAMAPLARKLNHVIVEQMHYIASIDGEVTPAEAQGLEQATKVRNKIDALKPGATDEGLFGAPAAYWLDLADYLPHKEAAKVRVPLLVLQGERDYQVLFRKDFVMWKDATGAKPNVTVKSYPSLNHLFMPGDGPSVPAEYATPSHVDPEVIGDIAAWLSAAR